MQPVDSLKGKQKHQILLFLRIWFVAVRNQRFEIK